VILLLTEKANEEQLIDVAKMYPGYTKVVVDIKRNVLAAGGEYHIDCEQVLIADGSIQSDLWGGGYRFESKEVDFMGLTNYKPAVDHLSYEMTNPNIREQVEKVIKKVFGSE